MLNSFRQEVTLAFSGALKCQWSEQKKDILFFGGFGVFLGYLANLYDQLEKRGVKLSFDLVTELMADFMPVKAAITIFCLLVMIAALRNLLSVSKFPCPKLAQMSAHVSKRLSQLTSSLTCFSFGYAAGLGFTILSTYNLQALILAILILAAGAAMFIVGVMGAFIEQGVGVAKSSMFSFFMLVSTLAYLVHVATYGFN